MLRWTVSLAWLLTACGPMSRDGLAQPDPREGTLTQALVPAADLYVRSGTSSSKKFGSYGTVIVDAAASGEDAFHGYMRFAVPPYVGAAKAKLRLYVTTSTPMGPNVIKIGNTTWSESSTTWNTKPSTSGTLVTSLGS